MWCRGIPSCRDIARRREYQRSQPYVFPDAIPRDLEAALAVAFSTLLAYSLTSEGEARRRFVPKDPKTKHIRVVAVTGLSAIAESPDLVSYGFADVIVKPMQQVEVLRTVQAKVKRTLIA